MSSHHIVRDEQEPALLVASPSFYTEQIGQLLEWSPVLAVLPSALLPTLDWACKIDVAVSRVGEEYLAHQAMAHQLPYAVWGAPAGADLLIFALQQLAFAGHSAANVLFAGLPSEWPSFHSYLPNNFVVVVYSNGLRWQWARQGHYEKWLPAGVRLHTDTPLEYSPEQCMAISPLLIETTRPGLCQLTANKPFWIGQI